MKLSQLFQISSLRSLQAFQLMRFGSTLLVSVFLARLLPREMVGFYEKLFLIGSSTTFFWVTGIINPFIPYYYSRSHWQKSRLIFNVFLLLSLLSVITATVLALLVRFPGEHQNKLFYIFLLFNAFNAPAFFLEYILLVNNKAKSIFYYGIAVSALFATAVAVPLLWDKTLITSLSWLAILGVLKYSLLIYYVKYFGNWKLHLKMISGFAKKISPYILSLIIGGSSLYIDSYVIEYFFNDADFAVFRYGANELPFVLLMANALSNVKSGEIATSIKNNNLEPALHSLKSGSARLMHYLFPLTIVLMFISAPLFKMVYGEAFLPSAHIFNIYLLLIISRLAFPQTLLLAFQQNRQLLKASAIEWALNIALDISFVVLWGMQGVAWATVLAYIAEKLILAWFCRKKGIALTSYFPLKPWLIYSAITILVFIITMNINRFGY